MDFYFCPNLCLGVHKLLNITGHNLYEILQYKNINLCITKQLLCLEVQKLKINTKEEESANEPILEDVTPAQN